MSENKKKINWSYYFNLLLRGLRHLFLHNGILKIIAILISVILWAGLISQDENLTRDKYFQNVNVTVTGTEVKAMQAGAVSEVARDSEDNPYHEYWVPGQQPGTWQIRVWNNQGVELPASGGIGTGIFTILGMILAAGAAIGLILRRGRRI